ncbi:excisionase family DNA binding protein [Dysgonomonas hofstadii]|uniref:Excisionase family DNA binding protein n=1 Tax=Dysgonomonas hofstadii TaxID=637886 RepID=A0A840D0F6_9BACT|nr:helix-turn-helix domain-containing protein [Dysgonomonas hofstadii]MBB4038122.1 excisionase family DNA binding protein [Dysgonomonas hofstadii]
MICTEITFEKLPEAVAYLIKSVSEIKSMIEDRKRSDSPKERIPIGIDEACCIIRKAKSTVYALVRKGLLPSYKRGKKLFFFEDELIEWIAKGRRKTIEEVRAGIETDMYSRYRRK